MGGFCFYSCVRRTCATGARECEVSNNTSIEWTDSSWSPIRVGKKAAGAMLDGREWREFPEVRHE